MPTFYTTLLSLLSAGALLLTGTLSDAAPHNDPTGLLFLANRDWRVSESYLPALSDADVQGQLPSMIPEAARALEQMAAACRKECGATMVTVSGFRSYAKQARLYENKLETVNGDEKLADEYVARPGASEHELGLAMDVGQLNKTTLTTGFKDTPVGKWVAENCARFGFILRYQDGWEGVTGYLYEPWHVRYVGVENAQQIQAANQPLEDYLVQLRYDTLMSLLTAE